MGSESNVVAVGKKGLRSKQRAGGMSISEQATIFLHTRPKTALRIRELVLAIGQSVDVPESDAELLLRALEKYVQDRKPGVRPESEQADPSTRILSLRDRVRSHPRFKAAV